MCLILVAWLAHPGYPAVIAANRDEFFARPTKDAGFWPEHPDMLAGRDLKAGGTWLGLTRSGRFSALTNYREPGAQLTDAPSRGELVQDFLNGKSSPETYLADIEARASRYNGFNLLCGIIGKELWHFSNRQALAPQRLAPGVYGLSNHLLDTPWPKVIQGKSALASALQALPQDQPILDLLRNDQVYPDADLPRTGVSIEWERLLSAAFVRSANYGTCSSTVLLLDTEGLVRFDEQTYSDEGHCLDKHRFAFKLTGFAAG